MACKNGQCDCRQKQLPFLNDDGPPIWLAILMAVLIIGFLAIASMMVNNAFGGEPPPVVIQLPEELRPHIAVAQGNGELPKALADLGVKQAIYDQYPTRPFSPVPVTILKPPHDADTLTDVTIHLPLNIELAHESVRAYGFDAWEVSKVRHSKAAGEITDEEIKKGLVAKDAFNQLLLLPSKQLYAENRLYVDIVGRDVFGRVLAWYYIKLNDGPTLEWMNVAVWARSNGHQRKGPAVTAMGDVVALTGEKFQLDLKQLEIIKYRNEGR